MMDNNDVKWTSFITGAMAGMAVLGAVLLVVFHGSGSTVEPSQRTDVVVTGSVIDEIHVVAPLVDNGTNRVYTEYVLVEVWTEVETENPLYPVGPELIDLKLPHLVRMTRGEYDNLCKSRDKHAGHL